MTAAKPNENELTCSATLRKGLHSEKPFSFTYTLRPDAERDDIVVDPEGQTARWFQFRGAVMSVLNEMELLKRARQLEAIRTPHSESDFEPKPEPPEVPSNEMDQLSVQNGAADDAPLD